MKGTVFKGRKDNPKGVIALGVISEEKNGCVEVVEQFRQAGSKNSRKYVKPVAELEQEEGTILLEREPEKQTVSVIRSVLE